MLGLEPPTQGSNVDKAIVAMSNPGAFADSVNGITRTFIIAGTLYAGTGTVGITSSESSNPRRAVPKAIR
ncbi:hypothetical protein GX50_07567 [[Emmonsia] crescens]|uniref:Amino acid permease/ SLC12A domain-containing protein n=1 Tax=[Emmonsia] crescens TaxID=73230 RepID=A0A2B7Z9J5_9EURO|nr:hypothetical protein GX50_07567 [Emmonsia crescens]